MNAAEGRPGIGGVFVRDWREPSRSGVEEGPLSGSVKDGAAKGERGGMAMMDSRNGMEKRPDRAGSSTLNLARGGNLSTRTGIRVSSRYRPS